jgi:ribosomal protein L40E
MSVRFSDILIHDIVAAYRLANLRDDVEATEAILSLTHYSDSLDKDELDKKLKKSISLIYLMAEAVDMLSSQGRLKSNDFLSALELLEKDQSIEIWGECSAFAKHILDNQILHTKSICKKCGQKNHETKEKCIYCGNELD